MQASTWQLMSRSAERGDLRDRIDDALWILRRGTHHHHGVVVDGCLHGGHIGRPVGQHGYPAARHAEVVAALLQGSVRRSGQHDVRTCDVALRTAALAGALHCQQQAFGAT
jgi:hypothetical protein